MRLLGLLALLSTSVVFGACESDSVLYSHDQVRLKRTEAIGKSSFYYLKDGQEVGKFWVKYGGMNDGFNAYLQFEGKKVILFSGDGHFESSGLDTSLFEYRRIGAGQVPKDPQNVCFISDFITKEIEKNKQDSSEVAIQYLTDNTDMASE